MTLARLAQAGDSAARERFFRRYGLRLQHIVSLRMGRLLKEFVEVEDIVQDAMVHCLTRLDEVEIGSEGEFRNWMAKVAVNSVRSEARRVTADKRDVRRETPQSRKHGSGDSGIVGQEATPSQFAIARELEERVEQALLALEPRQREVFVLSRLCGMSFGEIARELGVAQSTVRAHLTRGLVRLSSILGVENESD